MSADDGGGREVAYRLFAAEYDDSSLDYTESDEERAPNYVITPTGARVNRLFFTGTLTEVTSVNEEMVRARVVDPTGAFVVYAGQYQPDELAFLERAEPPMFVAVTGKARTFRPEDADRVYTSVRPESIATIDADTRDRWVVSTAEQTLARIAAYADAAQIDAHGEGLTATLREAGLQEGLATGIPLAQDYYGTTPAYLTQLRELAIDAVRVVAGDCDEVAPVTIAPGETDDSAMTFADLAAHDGVDIATDPTPETETEHTPESTPAETTTTSSGAELSADSTTIGAETVSTDEPDSDASQVDAARDQGAVAEHAADEESGDTSVGDESVGDETNNDERSLDETMATVDTDDRSESVADESDSTPAEDSTLAAGTSLSDSEDGELGDFESDGLDMYEMDEEEREEVKAEFGTEFTTGAEVDEPGESEQSIATDEPTAEETVSDESVESESLDTEPTADESAVTEPAADNGVEKETEDDTAVAAEDAATAEESAEDEVGDDEVTADTGAEPADDEATDEPDEPADIDLQSAVVETMADLDDGSGADRGTVIDRVATDTGASADDVETAIQEALMSGQCYEPDDDTLKAI